MKSYIFGSFVFLILSAFFVTACDAREEEETAMDDTEAIGEETMEDENYFWTYEREYTYADRDQYRTDFNEARAKLDQRIQELETKAENATGETKEWYNKKAEELRNERQKLDNEWENFENATEENWNDFTNSIESGWNDIEESWNDIEVRVTTDEEPM